ncbi:MAG: FkbM family methyltransferase [Acidimicrobiia bacterium]
MAELDLLCADAFGAFERATTLQSEWRVALERLAVERRAVVPGSASGPASRSRWVSLPVTGPGGLAFSMVVDPEAADPLAAGLAVGAAFDQLLIELMLRVVRPGDVVVDVGAHLGQFSLPAAAAGCQVLAVEASPLNAALLRASAAENGFTGMRVVQAASSDRPGTVSFRPDGPFGHVALGADAGATIDVPAVTLDEVLQEFAMGPVAFVKIDVEGSEIATLAGMNALLSQPDGPPVLIESNGHTLLKFSATPRDLLGQLEDLGYSAHIVEAHRLIEARATDFQPQTIVDYLAVKRLPPGAERIEVQPRLTVDEQAARVVADASLYNEDHRKYMATALEKAGDELLTRPEVVEILEALLTDQVDAVGAAAAWWADRRRAMGRMSERSEERS